MGTYNLGGNEIEDSLKQWLKDTSEGEGDITAEALADAYNSISKKYRFGDRLCAMQKCMSCNKYFPETENREGNIFYDGEQCKKCRDKEKGADLKEKE